MNPPMIHAAKTSVAEPTARAMSLATRKTPVPMVSPMTMAVADHKPSPRINSDRSDGLQRTADSGPLSLIKFTEPTISHERGQRTYSCYLTNIGSADIAPTDQQNTIRRLPSLPAAGRRSEESLCLFDLSERSSSAPLRPE